MLKELTQVQMPEKFPVENAQAEPYKKVRQYFEDELREFISSLQNSDKLTTGACNFVYYLFFLFSTIWMLFFYRMIMSPQLGFVYACILVFLLINAMVSATFSTVIYRYQFRVFWILPATNAVVILNYYYQRYLKANARDTQNQTTGTTTGNIN